MYPSFPAALEGKTTVADAANLIVCRTDFGLEHLFRRGLYRTTSVIFINYITAN